VGGEVHHQNPLRVECGLVPYQRVWLDRGSGLLAGKLASPWHCILHNGGLSSMGLRFLPPPPPMTSVALLEREADIWPWHHRPRWNHHHGLSG
jgi:hypothetical protein